MDDNGPSSQEWPVFLLCELEVLVGRVTLRIFSYLATLVIS